VDTAVSDLEYVNMPGQRSRFSMPGVETKMTEPSLPAGIDGI
jgi:hypothetical protein